MVELQLHRVIDGTPRSAEHDSLGLFAGEGFLGALADEVALDFGGQAECECENFAGDVVAEPVVVLDGPDAAAAHHADIEYLHDHEQVAPETRQLGTYDEVAAADSAEKFPQTPDRPVLGATDSLLYPAIDGNALPVAELENFKSLILNCLLVAAHSDVSEIHNAHSTIMKAVRIIRAAFPALCRMHRQAQLFQN